MLSTYVFNLTYFEQPNCLFYNNIAILFQVRQVFDKKFKNSKVNSSHSAACSTCVRKYLTHGLRTPSEDISFTARPKIQSQSQIIRYGQSIFCLPHRPNFSDIFDLCLHWVSVVRDLTHTWTCVRAWLFPFEAELLELRPLEILWIEVNGSFQAGAVRNKVIVYKSCGDSKNRMFMKQDYIFKAKLFQEAIIFVIIFTYLK
jgi:hypothetical protein